MRHSNGKSARVKAAALLGTAGALVLGYALLQPAGGGKIPGWEPVNPQVEEALNAMDDTGAGSSSGTANHSAQSPPSGTAPAGTTTRDGAGAREVSPAPSETASAGAMGDTRSAVAFPPPSASGLSVPDPSASSAPPAAAATSAEDGRFDLNAATAEQLDALKGIGPSKAKAIVDYRDKHGPYRRVDDLLLVKGIGEKLLAAISPYVYVAG